MPATPVKRGFLEISRRATFQNIPVHVLELLTQLQIAAISPVTLLRSDSTTDTFQVISKSLAILIETNSVGLSFQ